MNVLRALDDFRRTPGDKAVIFDKLLDDSGLSTEELEVGALNVAFRKRLEAEGISVGVARCSFCHRSQREVKTLVVATEAAICDQCVEIARTTVQPATKGPWFLPRA
jgi:recombinational DNA repair protein (RecF pathway)